MSLDLAEPLRTAIVDNYDIATLLGVYLGEPCVFTRRPAPTQAPYPIVMVSPDITHGDQDAISSQRSVIMRDVAVYGQNDTAENYRTVEQLAYMVRALFHRQRTAITVDGHHVIDITATGPMPGPTDDDQTVGRIVTLTIRIQPNG